MLIRRFFYALSAKKALEENQHCPRSHPSSSALILEGRGISSSGPLGKVWSVSNLAREAKVI